MNTDLLKALCEVHSLSGDESKIRDFILKYIQDHSASWKVQPELFFGEEFQEVLILKFGDPRTAVYAHMDSIGFTVGYDNALIKVGGPKTIDGTILVGEDSKGPIEGELMVIEHEDKPTELKLIFEREVDRGTNLAFKIDFRVDDTFVQTAYLDNRLGCLNALELCETLSDGVIVFSTYEEVGGGAVGFIAKYLKKQWGIRQALISDITWVTNGVGHEGGVAISMRDSGIPRRVFLNRVTDIAKDANIPFQLEVESAGGSDGMHIQKSSELIDWLFIGAPEDHVHSPDEKVAIKDYQAMNDLYKVLMEQL